MVPAKRPREEAHVDDDAARVIPEQQAAVAFAVAAAVGGATPSKSVRLNLTQGESAEKEEIKSLGAFVVAAESSNVVAGNHVVTPALVRLQPAATTTISDPPADSSIARRALFSTPTTTGVASSLGNKKTQQHVLIPPTITPSRRAGDSSMLLASVPVAAKRKLIFGRLVTETAPVQENVRQVYGIIRKFTGGIGGNGSHGPIYGELTMGSMQKMVNLMKQHAGLCETSRFIDVGSGIGKPNFHVAQDPVVEFSYGIEIEADRWLLGMSCLKQVLNVAASQQQQQEQQTATTGARAASSQNRLQHRMLFEHGDIRNAKTFDPFTHVYMFSIG
jgi:Histone methylation protein DOT1